MANVIFNFADLTADGKAAKKVAQTFSRAGANAVQSECDGRTKRSSSVSYKELSFVFADGQQVTLGVKQSGDIFQAKLNGRVVPLKNPDDHPKAVAELVKMMDAGRAKFQQALAKKRVELPKGIKTSAPKMADALQARGEQLDAEIASTKESIATLEAELAA